MKKIALYCLAAVILFASCNSGGGDAGAEDTTTAAESPKDNFDIASNWKIGIQMWTFNHFTFTQALDKVDSAGVKSIEAYWGMPLGGDMKGEFGASMDTDTRAKLKQLLQSKGVQIVAMGVIAPQDRKEWQQAFDLAKEFGLSYITTEPSREQWDYIDSMAGTYGIKLAIHDHPKPNNYWTPDSVIAAMQGHPNIGACADVGHWARNGLNPADCIKKLEGHVYGVHLKDIVKFDDPKSADTVVGKGVIDFPSIFSELKRQRFNGMLSIEHESNWLNNLPDVVQTVKYYDEQVAKLQ